MSTLIDGMKMCLTRTPRGMHAFMGCSTPLIIVLERLRDILIVPHSYSYTCMHRFSKLDYYMCFATNSSVVHIAVHIWKLASLYSYHSYSICSYASLAILCDVNFFGEGIAALILWWLGIAAVFGDDLIILINVHLILVMSAEIYYTSRVFTCWIAITPFNAATATKRI